MRPIVQIAKPRADVGIMGAGIMGCCLALELAQRGHRVDLFDRASAPMTGASLHNEGKLHLGFVYANDPHKQTHSLMARGSLSFARIIQKLTGLGPAYLLPSRRFYYFVPHTSQLSFDDIHEHFQAVEDAVHSLSQEYGELYLGRKTDCYFKLNSLDQHTKLFSPELTLGSFSTWERAVSPDAVAAILIRATMSHPNIHFIGSTEIMGIHRTSDGQTEIESLRDRQCTKQRFPVVANCLWDDKLRVDATAGIISDDPWLLRYKATIKLELNSPARMPIPSATGILGPYGDLVNNGDRSYYVSWYPSCKLCQTNQADGRQLRELVHKSKPSRIISRILPHGSFLSRKIAALGHRKFIRESVTEMAAFVPLMAGLLNHTKHCIVGGGVILAHGSTDIDDPTSLLHQRHVIGPVAHGSYITINTGKYCMAPFFALEAADMAESVLSPRVSHFGGQR